jgi:hypothetical protein
MPARAPDGEIGDAEVSEGTKSSSQPVRRYVGGLGCHPYLCSIFSELCASRSLWSIVFRPPVGARLPWVDWRHGPPPLNAAERQAKSCLQQDAVARNKTRKRFRECALGRNPSTSEDERIFIDFLLLSLS